MFIFVTKQWSLFCVQNKLMGSIILMLLHQLCVMTVCGIHTCLSWSFAWLCMQQCFLLSLFTWSINTSMLIVMYLSYHTNILCRNSGNEELYWNRYSSLFSIFKDEQWWWMAVLKARKLTLVLVQLASNKVIAATLSFLCISVVCFIHCYFNNFLLISFSLSLSLLQALFAHSYKQPYFIKDCNSLEHATLAIWLFFLFCLVSSFMPFIIVYYTCWQ